ncbi:MAG: peptidylprolyl isomerase, partial [Paracoccaceae bacterium]
MRLTSILLAALTGLLLAAPLQAQSKFSPVIKVNEQVITQFELDQRITFLTVLKFPGDIRAEAEKGLIEDRLRMDQAKALGIKIAPQMIDNGMSEFASRANLTSEQFLQAIGEAGIAPETFRDFVEAGVAWREVVRARFAGQISVSAADIARAKDAENGRGKGFQVLLSEIFLPAQAGSVAKNIRLATEIAEGEHGSFAEAAAKYSAAASRLQGGAIDWLPVSSLPPQVANALGKLGQGQISEPVQLPGYIGVFQLRGMRDG